jgi:Holliday junction resolvase RusA-like endonuclease
MHPALLDEQEGAKMPFRLIFELDGLPKTTNGAHGCWQAAAKERKKWRQAVCLVAYFRRPEKPLEKVRVTCTRFSSSKPDYDNLAISFKSVIDGLVDGKIISDDKSAVIVERKYLHEKASPKKGKIRVEVEEV